MKYKIGVFGSAVNDQSGGFNSAKKLGQILAQLSEKVIVITGACSGLPYVAAKEAADGGAEVWGFSPAFNIEGQKLETPNDDISIYSKLIYVPSSFPFADNDRICKKYRNVISTASCDAGIIVSGRWGTLNEFTNLVDFQKIIGVLTGTGGIADELSTLSQTIRKDGQGKLLFNDSPRKLVDDVIEQVKAAKST